MNITTLEQLTQWRRDLHQIPELSLQEFETSTYIRTALEQMGLTYLTPMETATLVYIPGQVQETILLRADIDALPIKEANDISFRSKHQGMMHACGHDGHTAILLGAVQELLALIEKGQLHYSVLAVFQPAEETFGGGNLLIQSFDFSSYKIQAAFAIHLNPDYDEGVVATRANELMASCTEFRISIKGKAAHVGVRERGINALNAASQVYQSIQTIPTFKLDAKHTNIIHVGTLNAGEALNSVPENAFLSGTIRTYDAHDFSIIQQQLERICQGVALATETDISIDFALGYPAVINDANLIANAKKAAQSANQDFVLQEDPYLLGEDFSFYAQIAPINYAFIGIRNLKDGYTSGLHTPTLQFNESTLVNGVNYLVNLVTQFGGN